MSEQPSNRCTALPDLIARARVMASQIARLCHKAEHVLQNGILVTDKQRWLDPSSVTVENFLAAIRIVGQREHDQLGSHGNDRELESQADQPSRLARILLGAWAETATTTARRPDVLRLLCLVLARPEVSYTYEVSRFAVMLALRARYQITYSNDSLKQLSTAYEHLVHSFLHQQRRRQTKTNNYLSFLADILCLEQWAVRAFSPDNLIMYYRDFSTHDFGVSERLIRESAQPAPELHLTGDMPDYASLINIAFTQPSLVPGLDDVTGGMLATVHEPDDTLPGGLVTLVAGPPGSGKTSLCLSLTERMAALGSSITYVSTEEPVHSLQAKRITLGRMGTAMWSTLGIEEDPEKRLFRLFDGRRLSSLAELTKKINQSFSGIDIGRDTVQDPTNMYLVFPRVVVIDSLTAILNPVEESDVLQGSLSQRSRRHVGKLLNDLRDYGISVFLVGGMEDWMDQGLAYLVDNIFTLEQYPIAESHSHSLRTLTIQKTRLQISNRGRHVLHLSGYRGVTVGPSLDSVLKSIRGRKIGVPRRDKAAFLWSSPTPIPGRLPFSKDDIPEAPVTIQQGAHVLLYGQGSGGKAALAMRIGLQPRVLTSETRKWRHYVRMESIRERKKTKQLPDAIARWLSRARLLVISFLYGKDYYHELARRVLLERFGRPPKTASRMAEEIVRVSHLYPGYIDPETLVSNVKREICSARLEGRPYTGVITDGVQNIVKQYPLLGSEPLLWPALYRLFWSEGIESVSTFTFFRRDHVSAVGSDRAQLEIESEGIATAEETSLFHLLVSSCDYVFVVERPLYGNTEMRVRMVTSPKYETGSIAEVGWDPRRMRFV